MVAGRIWCWGGSEHGLYQKRGGGGDALLQAVVERLHRGDPRSRNPHRARQPHPVEVRVTDIEHVERLAAGVAGADIGELAAQDRIAAVRAEEGGDVDALAGLRP